MNGKETRMDADAPINIPIRLERWNGHDILQHRFVKGSPASKAGGELT